MSFIKVKVLFICTLILVQFYLFSQEYHVGPSQNLASISEVPWTTLQAGDHVFIHWREEPYREKWVINRKGTEDNPIIISGVLGPNDEMPVIDGRNATTATGLDYWNESRGIIKIGGSSRPKDGLPQYIVIENLDIRSGRPPYQFKNDRGVTETYARNAAAIYIEKGANLIIRNCILHDCGNGLFLGAYMGKSKDILIEKNHIYDNGIEDRIYEHNTYTAAINVTYQYNYFGPLRKGARGNNLKDRSAGLIVRYNWIEGGNRQLDLVDAEDSEVLVNHANYRKTHVYGNILIEPEGAGNSQMVHYGGDSGTEKDYRKGTLYFYNNTVISTRSDYTTLIRLSSNDESALVFNNVIFTSSRGDNFAMMSERGTFRMHHNWLKENWKESHSTIDGQFLDLGNNRTGTDPEFIDINAQDFHLSKSSPLIDWGDQLPDVLKDKYAVDKQYYVHQNESPRPKIGIGDIGAYEYEPIVDVINPDVREIKIFPNPSSGKIIVQSKFEISSVHILDQYGKMRMSISDMKSPTLDLSRLSPGIYFIQLQSRNGAVTHKVILL